MPRYLLLPPMNTRLPPLFTGRIPTSERRLLLALVLTLLLFYTPNSLSGFVVACVFMVPLWLGFFIAYRPWRD